jgi:hypothetical protein
MRCPVGRTYDSKHVTCISCEKQLGKCSSRKKKKTLPIPTTSHTDGNKLVTTQYLYSLNKWNNKPRFHYVAVRRSWEKVLYNSVYLFGRATGKRLLVIKRIVPSKKHLIKDRDNLFGSIKPIKDILTKQGVFIDDSDNFLSFEISQEVSKTDPRVELTVTDL